MGAMLLGLLPGLLMYRIVYDRLFGSVGNPSEAISFAWSPTLHVHQLSTAMG
jgi:hypothetical protein